MDLIFTSLVLTILLTLMSGSQETNLKTCLSNDRYLLELSNCPHEFIGMATKGSEMIEMKCPGDAMVGIISVHYQYPACKMNCNWNSAFEQCRDRNICLLHFGKMPKNEKCGARNFEINFICLIQSGSQNSTANETKKDIPAFCRTRLRVPLASSSGFTPKLSSTKHGTSRAGRMQREQHHSTKHHQQPDGSQQSMRPLPSRVLSHAAFLPKPMSVLNKVQSLIGNIPALKTPIRRSVYENDSLQHRSNDSEKMTNFSTTITTIYSDTSESPTTYPVSFNFSDEMGNNNTRYTETFVGRQISLWFTSINEPHLIGVFIKSNAEKFTLYLIVFICVGLISVMGVVIYSLVQRIRHRRTYVVNKNKQTQQQTQGKISYHSTNNWTTPESESSTGDDHTLHDDDGNNMDGTDSRNVMCSSLTENPSNKDDNPSSVTIQPPNSSSARGSTTLPSPPNSLIFERNTPLASSELNIPANESPRCKQPEIMCRPQLEENPQFVDHMNS